MSDGFKRWTVMRKLRHPNNAALNDKGEIPAPSGCPHTLHCRQLAENSKELHLARKTLSATRSKQQLQGLYEANPEGAALIKNVRFYNDHQIPRPRRHGTAQIGSSTPRDTITAEDTIDSIRGLKDCHQPPRQDPTTHERTSEGPMRKAQRREDD